MSNLAKQIASESPAHGMPMTSLDQKENLARYRHDLVNTVAWLGLGPPCAELLRVSEVFFLGMNPVLEFLKRILLCYWSTDAPAD